MSEPAEVDFEQFSCPLPMVDYEHVLLGHGSGGTLTADLIKRVFIEGYGSTPPPALEDQATLTLSTPSSNGHKAARIALTTDSFVVRPPFFPGGDIGRLAVHGTVNDLAVGGATPLYLSAAFILEEGLPMADLRRIVASMREACAEAGVSIVTGDTKVVDRGKGDQIFLTIGNCRGRRGPALSTGRVVRVCATRPWASPSASANCARWRLPGEHLHLVDLRTRRLVCCCQACALLFSGGQSTAYRRVPQAIRSLPDFRLSDAQWESLLIPINLRIVGQHPITETILGMMIALLTVASIGLGFLAGLSDFRRYLHIKRL